MSDAPKLTARRPITSVDLGDLKPHVERRSVETGATVSAWLRSVIQRELEGTDPGALPRTPSRRDPLRRPTVYRAWLEPDLVAKLDRLCATLGLRHRAAALRALLEGVPLTAAPGANLATAVTALGISNHRLVGIARDLRRITQSLAAEPGKTTLADRLALERAEAAIRQHLEQAAQLVARLRPTLRPPRSRP